jgi:hypothetical protein
LNENKFLSKNYSNFIKYLNFQNKNLTITSGVLNDSDDEIREEYDYGMYKETTSNHSLFYSNGLKIWKF